MLIGHIISQCIAAYTERTGYRGTHSLYLGHHTSDDTSKSEAMPHIPRTVLKPSGQDCVSV